MKKTLETSAVLAWLFGSDARDPRIKKWGMIYALDLTELHDDRSMAQTAESIGCTRAAISTQARSFIKTFGVKPSRWMKKQSTIKKNRAARIKHCEDHEQ